MLLDLSSGQANAFQSQTEVHNLQIQIACF